MTKEKVQNLLADVGFSGLEAAVYIALLHEPSATGYRVAQMVGKPVANTYKALDSLRVKGAILADESSGTRSYTAISINEYLDGLRRNLSAKQELIEEELKDVAAAPLHGGIFRLTSVAQVYERCRNMIRNATSALLVDAFPDAFEKIRADLGAAIKRGVKVYVKTYTPTKLAGCDLLTPRKEQAQLRAWNGEWLNIYADCGEYIQSLLKKNDSGIHEAVWSRNPYLALIAYSSFITELVLTKVGEMLDQDKKKEEIIQEARRLERRYMSHGCMWRSIPDSWTTKWWKDELAKIASKTDEK